MNAARLNLKELDPRRARRLVRLACCGCAAAAMALWMLPLRADGLEGRFEVRSADLELSDGVYHLELDLSIKRVRQLLPNSSVAELTQRYRLQFNAVSSSYILRNVNSGQQVSVGTLDAAIEQLSGVRSLPVLDKALIAANRRYEASLRGKIDFGTVPFSLRLLMFWVSDWHRESDWYAWTFQP
jgi:hypothetical protein